MKQMDIYQDNLQTGTAIGCCMFHELCLKYLLPFTISLQHYSKSCQWIRMNIFNAWG